MSLPSGHWFLYVLILENGAEIWVRDFESLSFLGKCLPWQYQILRRTVTSRLIVSSKLPAIWWSVRRVFLFVKNPLFTRSISTPFFISYKTKSMRSLIQKGVGAVVLGLLFCLVLFYMQGYEVDLRYGVRRKSLDENFEWFLWISVFWPS